LGKRREIKTLTLKVYLEIGHTRTFAVVPEWPGWCRSGRDEASAIQTLVDYGPRYARVLEGTGLGFVSPASTSSLVVIERLPGNGTTDFGAPDTILPSDHEPTSSTDLERWRILLPAVWTAFDRAVQVAEGKDLRKGPRGGGRDLVKMADHVRGGEEAYLVALGGVFKSEAGASADQTRGKFHAAIFAALEASIRGEIAPTGPRGGKRWPPPFFVRRLAWHGLDHAWEIEDRVEK
jgi:hypothetical protein